MVNEKSLSTHLSHCMVCRVSYSFSPSVHRITMSCSRVHERLVRETRPAYEALGAQLQAEQSLGRGAASDFVFSTASGRPINRGNLSKRGVASAAKKAGLGHVTAQTLRRSVATATAHARLPVVVAAAMTGHSKDVYDSHYAKPFRDAEERERVRESLAAIGFGNGDVDHKLTDTRSGGSLG